MASGGRTSRPNALSWAGSNGVTIGSPNAPNVILMVAEQTLITTLIGVAVLSLGFSESAFVFLALVVAVLFAISLMTCEVRVDSESISRRSLVRRLGRAVDEAGLMIDDQKSAWRRAHPIRTMVSWCSRAVAEASLLGHKAKPS